jgi:MscS family membrane protein
MLPAARNDDLAAGVLIPIVSSTSRLADFSLHPIHREAEGAMWPTLLVTVLLLALGWLPPVWGQTAGAPAKAAASAQPAPEDSLGRESPRAAVLGFIKAAGADNYERAAQYLDARRTPKAAEELALQLKVILDRRLSAADIDLLSAKPEGNLDDDLPPTLERVGEVKGNRGSVEVLLERVSRGGDPPIWLFAAKTLKAVPALYDEIRPFWFERHMPSQVREFRIFDLPLWQWIALALAVPIVLGLTWLLSRLLFQILRPLLFRLTGERADANLAKVTAPVRLLTLALAIGLWLSVTSLPLLTRFFWARVAVAAAIAGLTWFLIRLVDIVAELTQTHLQHLNQPARIAIAQLVRRLTKVVVVVLGALALLYLANLDLTAALAGLGIGGIAVAFAAQKTLENLFGGVLIISDQPVRVGDFCKIGNVMGTVEDFGLRSTRIRTLDRTVVSVPNGQMAAENVENFGVRDKIWFRPTIGLRYETTADQLRYVLAEIRHLLYAHPMVESQSARIRFVRFAGSSLDLELFAYVLTSDYARFLEVQEDLLLRIMDIVEASGTGIAFPSQTAYLARDRRHDESKREAAIATVRRWRESRELPFPNFRPERIAEVENTLEYPPPESALRKDGRTP